MSYGTTAYATGPYAGTGLLAGPGPDPDITYVADIRVGNLTWTCEAPAVADPDAVNVLAGASFVWAAPDDVGWPPPLHTVERDVLTLTLAAPDADQVGGVRRGDVVRFRFTPTGYTYDDPLVDFAGRVRAVRVVDRTGGGVFLQLTAADHVVALQDWTVPGETVISTDGDTQAEVLERIAAVLSTLNSRDMVPGTFGDPLPATLDPYYAGTVGDYTIGAGELATGFDLFATYGMNMFPVPNYDPDTGDLDATNPYVIEYLDPIGGDFTELAVDSCRVPVESVEWQRDYIPNVVEESLGSVYWAGETYSAPMPDYPDWNLTRAGDLADLNLQGFRNQRPEPGPWSMFTFTVRGWEDPESVRGWLTLPDRFHDMDRFRTYVTVTGIDPTWNPNGTDTVSGMLGSATWTMGNDGRWTVLAHLRPARGNTDADIPTWDDVPAGYAWDDVPAGFTWNDAWVLPD